MAEKNKPKSKLQRQWDEIKDLSSYVRPEDKEIVDEINAPFTEKEKFLIEASGRHRRAAREMGPIPFHGGWMKRHHANRAEAYIGAAMIGKDIERTKFVSTLAGRRNADPTRKKGTKHD